MPKQITISLDAMGGDAGPEMVLSGATIALERRPDLRFVLFGDEARLKPLVDARPTLAAASRLVHAEVVVRMDDKPSQALRAGRWKSSMWKAIEAVKAGEAQVCVSAGNTGALGAMAKFCLRTMAGIERPALAAIWPTLVGNSIVLDVGATIGADAQQLVDFSVMGAAMARALYGVDRPKVGLLNVGVEDIKGNEEVKMAGRLLKGADLAELDYTGFVEGDDIGRGVVHVVVTEGFAGNIALKTAEGTAKQFAQYLREGMMRSWWNKLGFFIARSAFDRVKEKMDPRKVNGGVFLGLNGIVIKSHGGTDPEGFASAVSLAYNMASADLSRRIVEGLGHYHRAGFVAEANGEQRGES